MKIIVTEAGLILNFIKSLIKLKHKIVCVDVSTMQVIILN